MKTILSVRLKEEREQKSISINQLATLTGMSKATISRIERCEIVNPNIKTVEQIAKILNINPAYLVGWSSKRDMEK